MTTKEINQTMGYVYVMEAGPYCKIGISEHDVKKRMQAVQTGCPFQISRVWCSRNIPDERECERALHEHFSDRKTHGEWFDVAFLEASVQADKVCRNGATGQQLAVLQEKVTCLEEENARLEEENAHLKRVNRQLEHYKEQGIAVEKVKLLEAENARLKAIVERVTRLLQGGDQPHGLSGTGGAPEGLGRG